MSEQELLTILHVDDNEINRYIVARMLRNAGFEVKEAATGKACLQLVAQQPNLIILDVHLPDIDGFEVCRRIKANPATSSIPVLHLSATFVKSEDKVQGLEGGADGYLAQPVEPIELIATVNALLRIRQAEESALALAREWQTIFNAMSDGVCLLDWEGKVVRCNTAMTNLLRKPFSEINGQFHQELMQTMPDSIEVTPFTRVQETHSRESMELQFGDQWFSVTTDPVFDERGAFTGAVYIVADITDRKWAAEQIKAALREKEVLLKEIHHRVKNNMQVICSLLNLQSGLSEDPHILEILQQCQNRVTSMALVHEQLYQSENLALIDFAKYIQNLVDNLFSSYDVSSEVIDLKININNIHLNLDAAIPCSLIINELISNSLKYAFIPGTKGEICIRFEPGNNNHLLLSISDNGIGFPQYLDFQNTKTMGLQLVNALTAQLSGIIELNRTMGTEFQIKFPNKT